MTATKTVEAPLSFAGVFTFDATEQAPVGATRLAYNEDGSLRSYYDVSGTKQFTSQGLAEFNKVVAAAEAVGHVAGRYGNPGWDNDNDWSDYTIWK